MNLSVAIALLATLGAVALAWRGRSAIAHAPARIMRRRRRQ
jgi:hypothetical protein